MKVSPPPKLESYRYDKKAELRFRLLTSVVGWPLFLSVIGMVVGFFRKDGLLVIGSFLTCFVLIIPYVRLSQEKRKFRCRQCKRRMSVLDVRWPAEQWQRIGKSIEPVNFKGADGNIYFTYAPHTKGINLTHFLDVRMQRWYACYECGYYFLGQKYVSKTVFSTHDQEILERKKQALVLDPKARL